VRSGPSQPRSVGHAQDQPDHRLDRDLAKSPRRAGNSVLKAESEQPGLARRRRDRLDSGHPNRSRGGGGGGGVTVYPARLPGIGGGRCGMRAAGGGSANQCPRPGWRPGKASSASENTLIARSLVPPGRNLSTVQTLHHLPCTEASATRPRHPVDAANWPAKPASTLRFAQRGTFGSR
jgi:hypothetical protein